MSPVACWELIGNHCVIRCDCAPPLPPEDAGRVYGPEFWLLTAQRSSAIITRTVHNRALASDFFLLISFFFFFFFSCAFSSPLKKHPSSLTAWRNSLFRDNFKYGSLQMYISAELQLSFRSRLTGFSQRDGYKWVRGAETFCCWGFKWVFDWLFLFNYHWNLLLILSEL